MPPIAPERGDFVWLEFDPQAGHEQAGRRPALVVSPRSYNQKLKLMVCCPVTSKRKGIPFEIVIPDGLPVSGVVLTQHMKSVDWRARNAQYICAAPVQLLDEVVARLVQILTE